jgi:hypothetical protein
VSPRPAHRQQERRRQRHGVGSRAQDPLRQQTSPYSRRRGGDVPTWTVRRPYTTLPNNRSNQPIISHIEITWPPAESPITHNRTAQPRPQALVHAQCVEREFTAGLSLLGPQLVRTRGHSVGKKDRRSVADSVFSRRPPSSTAMMADVRDRKYRTTAVMASPQPRRYALRSQAFWPCRGSDP